MLADQKMCATNRIHEPSKSVEGTQEIRKRFPKGSW